MTRRGQLRLIYYGALLMLISMSVEAPGMYYPLYSTAGDFIRQYLRTTHAVLMPTGIWMIATGAILPLLELTSRGVSWTVWSMVVSAYTFLLAMAVLIVGLWIYPDALQYPTQIFQLDHLPVLLKWTNLGLLLVSGVTSLIAALVIVWGAVKSLRHSPIDDIH